MTDRTVNVGVMTFIEQGGLTQFALRGAVVNVADEDLERFDRLNGSTPVESPRKPGRPRKNP